MRAHAQTRKRALLWKPQTATPATPLRAHATHEPPEGTELKRRSARVSGCRACTALRVQACPCRVQACFLSVSGRTTRLPSPRVHDWAALEGEQGTMRRAAPLPLHPLACHASRAYRTSLYSLSPCPIAVLHSQTPPAPRAPPLALWCSSDGARPLQGLSARRGKRGQLRTCEAHF